MPTPKVRRRTDSSHGELRERQMRFPGDFAHCALGVRRCCAAFSKQLLPGNHVVGRVEIGIALRAILTERPSDYAKP